MLFAWGKEIVARAGDAVALARFSSLSVQGPSGGVSSISRPRGLAVDEPVRVLVGSGAETDVMEEALPLLILGIVIEAPLTSESRKLVSGSTVLTVEKESRRD